VSIGSGRRRDRDGGVTGKLEQLHFVGICGRAMGAIAVAMSDAGHRVTGSDEDMYPPVSVYLQDHGLHIATPYRAGNVPPGTDRVVVGKRVAEDNPELRAVLARGLPCTSFPRFLHERFLSTARNAVVAGGVGKTTTTAMLAWILEEAGLGPDYLIGGMARNFAAPARFRAAGLTVIEGDEYACSFDDPAPKFLQYAPEVAVITNLLADHPDLYPDPPSVREAFAALVRLLPPHGCLILSADDDDSASLAREARCPVRVAGIGKGDRSIERVHLTPRGSCFRLDGAAFELPLTGTMNVRNAAMAALAAERFHVSLAQAARALASFRGILSRQQPVEAGSCVVVTDKASHPASIAELSRALRQGYPGRRIVSVIQPRATGGKHWVYQRDLPAALAGFDKVILTNAYEHKPSNNAWWRGDPFSIDTLACDLRQRGVDVTMVNALADLPEAVRATARAGDVVLMLIREQFATLVPGVARALRA
jgi:UDP-N-acetylmuramate: L-alanyl-gamma-D-glutamyl-meso-diaminopimelate ligase